MIPEFIDTMQVYGPSFYLGKEMLLFYNPVASTPSLHFSWTVLFACVAWSGLRVSEALGPGLSSNPFPLHSCDGKSLHSGCGRWADRDWLGANLV